MYNHFLHIFCSIVLLCCFLFHLFNSVWHRFGLVIRVCVWCMCFIPSLFCSTHGYTFILTSSACNNSQLLHCRYYLWVTLLFKAMYIDLYTIKIISICSFGYSDFFLSVRYFISLHFYLFVSKQLRVFGRSLGMLFYNTHLPHCAVNVGNVGSVQLEAAQNNVVYFCIASIGVISR